MMRLRAECIKFGGEQLPKVSSSCGALKFQIPKSVLENLLDEGFSINEISTLLSISESTVYRRMRTFGLSKLAFSEISDDDLARAVNHICQDFPRCGENMSKQILSGKGIKVQGYIDVYITCNAQMHYGMWTLITSLSAGIL